MSVATSTKAVATKAASSRAVAKQEADAKEQAKLDALIAAVKLGVSTIGTTSKKVEEVETLAEQVRLDRGNARVATARTIAELAKHPATFGKTSSKGKPAASTIATLTGIPRTTLLPLFNAAMALTEKKWERRTAAPTANERELVNSFYKDEVARKQAGPVGDKKDGDTKGKGKGKQEVKKITATLEGLVTAADILDQTAVAFGKTNGLSAEQFDALETKLGSIINTLKALVPATK